MSGHSHYATIHRQKELNDAKRGKIFSKYAREIAIAVREGGGTDPAFNYKLRIVMEKARAANMPKDNIERAITKGGGPDTLEVVTYEGFGPKGISLMIEAATDNRNRTSQEIKNILERVGGSMAGPGSVSFNFENKGLLLVKKTKNLEEDMLKLIDLGVEEIEDTDDGIEAYTSPDKLREVREKLEAAGFTVISSELYMKPKSFLTIDDPEEAKKVLSFLDILNDQDDVQRVFTNLDVPENIVNE